MSTPAPAELEPTAVDRSRSRDRWRGAGRAVVVVLLAGAAGLVLVAGIAMLAAPSSTVTGEVVAYGAQGNGECYPTVAYAVDGETYRTTPDRADRWCALKRGESATVYYDPDEPQDGRLSRYGDLPGQLVRAALVALVAAGFVATMRWNGGRHTRAVAWVLLGAWAATVAATVLTSERQAALESLHDAIADGDVDEVTVWGALGAGARGTTTVELRWTDNGLHYVTEVRQRRDRHGLRTHGTKGDVESVLTENGGAVELARGTRADGGLSAGFLGWRLDGGLLWPFFAAIAMTVRLIWAAAEPWRATRWGWFWLVFAIPPVGGAAYLLLGGPTGVARPTAPGRRLTGGWAFLLGLCLSSFNRL